MNKDIYQSLATYSFSDIFRNAPAGKIPSVVIFGNFGARNIGDEAILAGEIASLQRNRKCFITVVGKNPRSITKIHKVKALSQKRMISVFLSLKNADAVIVGGGGIFCKAESGMGIVYQLYTLLLFVLLPILMKKHIYVLGIGFYKNTNILIKRLAIFLFRKVKVITVRDMHSYTLLAKEKLPVHFYKDHSFLMDLFTKSSLMTEMLFKKQLTTRKKNVALLLKNPGNTIDRRMLSQALTRFIATSSSEINFWFYNLDTSTAEKDDALMKQIYTDVKKHGGYSEALHSIPFSWSPKKIFSSLQLMDAAIAMRLHGMIFSYRLKIPFIGISYDIKCTSFLDSIGQKVHSPRHVSAKDFLQLQLSL